MSKPLFTGVLLLALLVAPAAWAQTPTGAIEGTISDSSGAVIPGAQVTITEAATGRASVLTTNDLGRYSMRALLPGLYNLKVESASFSTKEVQNISISSGSVHNGNLTLEVGRTADVVQVAAEAVTVESARQTVDNVITEKEIKDIPLFRRNFLELAALAPGVHIRDGGSIDPTKEFAYLTVGVNGRSGTGTRVQIDGIDVTDETVGSTTANMSQDSVAEFQLTRSSLDVSTSLTSSGAININSRYGGNDFHGTVFWDYHNQDMGARLDYNAKQVPFKRNRISTSTGGRLVKDKVFYQANWERHYITSQDIVNKPEFPQLTVSQPFPAGIRYTSGRIDWNVSSAVRVFYRFQHDWNLATGGDAISPFQNVNWTNVNTIGLNFYQPRMTHSYRFGFVNFNNRIQSEELEKKFPVFEGQKYFLGVGTFQAGPNSLAPQQTYQDNWQNSYEGSFFVGRHTMRYGFSMTRIDLGGFANFAGPLSIFGSFDAATLAAVRARGGNVQDPLEFPFEAFSTGPQSGFFHLRASHNLPYGGKLNNRFAWYVQDSVRVTKNLALNFGIRWQYDSGYFPNDKRVPRDQNMELFGRGFGKFPEAPKKLFSPSFGFAWDPWSTGKTVIRGGIYKAFEMNIWNNTLFDEFAMIPPGIGPDFYDNTHVAGPDGRAINVDGRHPDGDYSDLEGRRLRDVLPQIVRIHQALQAAYSGFKFDPKSGTPQFTLNRGNVFGGSIPGDQFKVPYAVQWNIGFQRELAQGTVLSVDYIHNHAVGLPFFLIDYERRRAASTLNVANARAQVNRVLGNMTVDQWLAANPTRTISSFGLISDAIFQGITPNFTRARFFQGGFSRYRGIQAGLRGRRSSLGPMAKDAVFGVSYALGRGESASAAGRVEFLSTAFNNDQWNQKENFGPNGLDFTHYLRVYSTFTVPGGFRLGSYWTFRTAAPQTIGVPNLGGAISGVQGFFGVDVNGDGGAGTAPRFERLPGINTGQYGRSVKTFAELNAVISNFNSNFAGKLTPHGQALVSAGLFNEAQLRRLGAVSPTIPLIPENNPNPFHNVLVTDIRLDRPIKLNRIKEGMVVLPFLDIFNLFNHAPVGQYGGLGGRFGALNYNYAGAPAGSQASDLAFQTHRLGSTRRFQIGVRMDF